MAETSAAALLALARRGFDDLAFRATAVIDRLTLWRQLPSPVADQCLRVSQYVSMRDGTRIAVDLYRPARHGALLDGPLPVVWTLERYHRARVEDGRLRTRLDRELWLEPLCRHGYVICVADVRGSGASFGSRPGLVMEHDRWDAWDITEWLAAQPWSNGRVGMFGRSFMGMTQHLAASTAPPHLVTIVPDKTVFDLYAFAWPGGVFRHDYARHWGANIDALDRTAAAAPVDADTAGAARSQALGEHEANRDIHDFFASLPFRDSTDDDGTSQPYVEQTPSRQLAAIAKSGVAVFQVAGWNDMWPRDALVWHRNLTNPRRLLIGPWAHTQDNGWKLFAERLRWYDYWLKGFENGVMSEAPIRYFTTGAPSGMRWRTATQWPLPAEQPTRFTFLAPASQAAPRAGGLGAVASDDAAGADSFTVDYAATSGSGSRWKNGYGRPFGYPDMSGNDARALTYTTAPLAEDLEITGHPVVSLWISATVPDVDLFVYLEEVRRSGYSEYVSEGVLRASHRATSEPPFDNLGLPWHRGASGDCTSLRGGDVVLLTFDLHPISRVFRRGRRLRVAITGADAENALTPVIDPPPVIRCHRGGTHASHIVLPVIAPSTPGRP